MHILSENIRRLRCARGFSQAALAHRLGVSQQCVSLWEHGESNPTVENIYTMSEVLGATFDELMGDSVHHGSGGVARQNEDGDHVDS